MENQVDYDIPAIRAKLLEKMREHAALYPTQVEREFPRILAKIADLWGTAELDAYFETLMLPPRFDRQGFPAQVASELLRLTTLHDRFGLAPKTGGLGWGVVEQGALKKADE